jgi:hypothetical protein
VRQLTLIPLAYLIGIAVYLVVFMLLVHKPLTVDTIGDYLAQKEQILKSTPGPRIIVFAGSNGRFSHSCAVISAQSGIACVNLSISADLGVKFQFAHYLRHLVDGDLVYLPMEYRSGVFYDPSMVGGEAPYVVFNEPRVLLSLYTPRGIAKAVMDFTLADLFSSIGEMLLARAHIGRRFSLGTMNSSGDETGHTVQRAALYSEVILSAVAEPVDPQAYANSRSWADLDDLLEDLQKAHVLTVGGLPTVFEDRAIPEDVVPFLTAFFAHRGGCMLILPNMSRYPRSWFYDTPDHLNESAQHTHSASLAPILAGIFRTRMCPIVSLR